MHHTWFSLFVTYLLILSCNTCAISTELKCLDGSKELTPLGRILGKLPLDPRLGKMIVLGMVFSVGDALAIIAAQSSNLSEIFNLGLERKRLAPAQRGFAASRNSDHLAILNAFQQWTHKSRQGEQAEIEFCQQRMLSLPALRMTNEAKVRIVFDARSFGIRGALNENYLDL